MMKDTSSLEEERDAEKAPLLRKSMNTGSSWQLGTIDRLQAAYGSELLWLIVGAMWVIKGFGGAIEGLASPFMLKEYHIPAAQGQVYQALIALPWSLKPIVGLLSDTFPIGGYNKLPYAALTAALGLLSVLAVGVTTAESMPFWMLVICLFLCIAFQANISLLVQGTYSAKLQECPDEQSRSALVAFDQFGVCLGGTLGALCVGVGMNIGGPREAPLIFALPALVASYVVVKTYQSEKRKDAREIALCWKRTAEQSELVVLAILLFLANVTLIVTGMHTDHPVTNGCVALAVVVGMAISSAILLTPVAAKIVGFLIIVCAVGYEHDGAMLYFCTDTEAQFPEGPHLSNFFYTSARLPANALFSLVGVLVFAQVSKGWTYRRWYSAVLFLMMITNIPMVMFYRRWNTALGIHDAVWVLFAQGFDDVACMWVHMPAITAFATLCPRGSETTVYGLLIGMLNLSMSASNSFGGLVLYLGGVNPSGARNESAQFEGLWMLAAVKPALSWVVSLLLLWALPDKVIGASLVDVERGSVTSGSLWKRWRGGDTAANV